MEERGPQSLIGSQDREDTASEGQKQRPSPLTGRVRAVKRVLEVDDGAITVLQDTVLLRVVLHQLRQCRKLLPSIQVVEIP